MKSQNQMVGKGIAVTLVTASLFLGVGCAKKSDGFSSDTSAPAANGATNNAPPVTSTPRDTDGPRGADFAAGATTAMTPVSLQRLTEYVGNPHPLNNPTDLRISVKLKESAYNQYSGDIYISYFDNGQYYTGHFNTDEDSNPGSGTQFPNWGHAFYNNWFTWQGKPVFHGFYSDGLGAIMLVIDSVIDQGDGSGASELAGSIWFKNYPATQVQYNPQNIPCWYVTTGPYDCRTLLVKGGWGDDGIIDPVSALLPTQSLYYTPLSSHPYQPEEPARGWKKLGTFTGLNKAKAFEPMATETP